MAWDSVGGYALLFGGYSLEQGSTTSQGVNDTWLFENGSWAETFPAKSPPPLVDAAMAFDPMIGQLVLFGGWTCPTSSCFSRMTNQTWEYDAGAWTQLHSASAPSPRAGAVMTYDPAYQGLILFGGDSSHSGSNGTSASPVADTWKFANGSWSNLSGSIVGAPGARSDASLAYDSASGDLVLFGGKGVNGTVRNDTWTLANQTWTNTTKPSAPPAMMGGSMVYLPSNDSMLLFGGLTIPYLSSYAPVNGTWQLSGGVWSRLHPAAIPKGRWAADLAFIPTSGYALLFGGEAGTAGSAGTLLNDSWTYENGDWRVLGTNSSLPPSGQSAMAFDSADNETVLLSAGYIGDSSLVDATWIYNAGVWTHLLTIGNVSGRSDSAITYDSKDGYVLLYGGESAAGSWLNDTWSFLGGRWTQLAPLHNPGRVFSPSMAYDSKDGYVVLFSGPESASLGTWMWNGTDWSKLVTKGSPSLSYYGDHPMAFDATDGYVVMAQAFNETCPGVSGACFRTWTYSGGNWTERTNLSAPLPPGLTRFDLAWDAVDKVVLLFGGSYLRGGLSNETWAYSSGTWTELYPPAPPPSRSSAGMIFDGADGYLLLFGGLGASGASFADTWTYSMGKWTEVLPALTESLGSLDVGVRDTIHLGAVPAQQAPTLAYLGLPPGCASEDSAVLDCVPTAWGNFTIRASLILAGSPTLNSTPVFLHVQPSPTVRYFEASLAQFQLGNSTTLSVGVEGGTAPFMYAYAGLPPGCAPIDSSSLFCEPTVAGNFTIDVEASDLFGKRANSSTVLSVLKSTPFERTGPNSGGAPRGSPAVLSALLIGLLVVMAAVAVLGRRVRRERQRKEGEVLVDQMRRLSNESDPPGGSH